VRVVRLSRILGHTKPSITLDVYAVRFGLDDAKEAKAELETSKFAALLRPDHNPTTPAKGLPTRRPFH
jgi:hypothetical protein